MARTLLVVPAGHGASPAGTCLGLVRALDRLGVKVAFFRLVSANGGPGLPVPGLPAWACPPEPLSAGQLEETLGNSGVDMVLEKIVAAWEPVCDRADVVVTEAPDLGPASLYAAGFSQALAAALDADVLLAADWSAGGGPDAVESGQDQADSPTGDVVAGLADSLAIAAAGYGSGEDGRVLGCVVHGLPADDGAAASRLTAALARRGLRLLAAVRHRPELSWPRVADLIRALRPQVLAEGDTARRIRDVAVFAQGVPGGLRVLTDGRLVVVPGDRHDVIMAACLAELNGTRLAALLLSAGTAPDPRIAELTRATAGTGLPILLTDDDSYQTATQVRDLDPGLPGDDVARVEAVTASVADALDSAWLTSLTAARSLRLSPAAFRYRLTRMAGAAGARIVLPEGTEPRIIQAAVACADRGITRSILLGDPDKVAAVARTHGLRLPGGVTITDPQTVAEEYVAPLWQIRRHRGWTEEMARDRLSDPIMVGVMMVQQGAADGMVAGAVHTTAATLRPALQVLGTRPGRRLVSSVFFMCLPDGVVLYGDCAVNPQPSAEDLADIAIQSADSARAFGIEPRVAMISFSTGTSGAGSDVEKVAQATRIVRDQEPGLAVDGPLQYDAAAVASVGQAKRPGSPVAGHASVFVFPDLDTGNATYKAVQRSAHVVSVGPMLQGLNRPVNDLSRGASVDDIIYTIALTAVQSAAIQKMSGDEGG